MTHLTDETVYARWLDVIDAGDWLMEAVYRLELEKRGVIYRVQ